mmetsp:Transcript_183000/g.579954  ORF Transcript_183000/g.579954 Transcript_183000/m.579954 type:complete len:499 (+) Transcript_183000:133-1629(+)
MDPSFQLDVQALLQQDPRKAGRLTLSYGMLSGGALLALGLGFVLGFSVRAGQGLSCVRELRGCTETLDTCKESLDAVAVFDTSRRQQTDLCLNLSSCNASLHESASNATSALERARAAEARQAWLQGHCSMCPAEAEGAEPAEPAELGEPLAGPKFAFVTMAKDALGSFEHLWAVFPLARALQRLSAYPLLVLTNQTTMPDGRGNLTQHLRRLNAHVMPLHKLDVPDTIKRSENPSWGVAYWKLQVWNLTRFDKLVWLDTDAVLVRGIDWLFGRDWMWAQRDDWFCKLNVPLVCSGLMLIFPSEKDFAGLQLHARSKLWEHGDQEAIADYFIEVRKRPIGFLADGEVAFGQCLGTAATPYLDGQERPVPGQWSTPAFVHKSGGYTGQHDEFSNLCFSHQVWRQYYQQGQQIINVCQRHPLGPYYRELFCESVRFLGIRAAESDAYCDDGCWYSGSGSAHITWGSLNRSHWCIPVQASASEHPTELGWPLYRSADLNVP